ncbi:MAG: hypothetical protein Q7S33_02710 [Nanoarchaeota archaeon]|nr:hypothetical protein [Nanoarchaeota archaeon]
MKRVIFAVFFLLIMLSVFVSAETIIDQLQNTDQIGKNIKNDLNQAQVNASQQTKNMLEQEIQVPSYLQTFAKLLFGLDKSFSLSHFIVYLCIWIMIFIIIFDIISFMPFANTGVLKFVASLVIAALISITGSLNLLASFFIDIGSFFKFAGNHPTLSLVIAILLILILVGIINFLSRKIKNKIIIAKGEEAGTEIKEAKKAAKVFSKGVEELGK